MKFPVCLAKADVQKEWLLRRALDELDGDGCDIGYVGRLGGQHAIVANQIRALRNVLDAGQSRSITGVAQRIEDMLPVIVQREAAMRQAQHAAAMGALTRNQRGATRRTGRGPAERHAEQNRLRGQALQIGCGHLDSVRLRVPAGIVRVNVKDVRTAGRPSGALSGSRHRGRAAAQELSASGGWHVMARSRWKAELRCVSKEMSRSGPPSPRGPLRPDPASHSIQSGACRSSEARVDQARSELPAASRMPV